MQGFLHFEITVLFERSSGLSHSSHDCEHIPPLWQQQALSLAAQDMWAEMSPFARFFSL